MQEPDQAHRRLAAAEWKGYEGGRVEGRGARAGC